MALTRTSVFKNATSIAVHAAYLDIRTWGPWAPNFMVNGNVKTLTGTLSERDNAGYLTKKAKED